MESESYSGVNGGFSEGEAGYLVQDVLEKSEKRSDVVDGTIRRRHRLSPRMRPVSIVPIALDVSLRVPSTLPAHWHLPQ